MDRLFMTREEAVRVLLEAHTAASGHSAAALVKHFGDRSARLEELDRLLLDVRAGRVDEFRLHPNDKTEISITD
jgi:hypothetical protein